MVEQITLDGIKHTIYDKGWGFYLVDANHQDMRSMLPRGPIEKITIDDKYLVLPGTKRKSLDEMKKSLDRMVSANNLPILTSHIGFKFALTLATFAEDFVFIEEGNEHWIRYEAFIPLLETLPRCNS